MTHAGTAQSETGALRALLVQHARDAFVDQSAAEAQWRRLGFTAALDVDRAIREYDAFAGILSRTGARLDWLPSSPGLTLDAIYTRDASIVTDRGVVLCRMGKAVRDEEPAAHADCFRALGLTVLGVIEPPGQLEGGDVLWLDERTLAVGRGYRTNAAGIAQLRALLGEEVEVIEVPLPHWRGPDDVFHLMSMLSPIDVDLAVAYSRLLPIPFRERLLDRGVQLVEVPDEEFDTMGANVLAIAPRRCIALAGNPRTRARLERAGAEVLEYQGREISLKGGGGPTCLTRPLLRE